MNSLPSSSTLDALVPLLSSNAVTAVQRYRLRAVSCDQPFLVVPLAGIKRLHTAGKHWECHPGQFLMMHCAMQADVENVPDTHTSYRAWVVAFPWSVVALARELLKTDSAGPANAEPASVGDLSDLCGALGAYAAEAETADPALRNYRLLGVLLALQRTGHGQFLLAQDPSLAARIRLAVSEAPARDWQSAHFEALFAMSGATLRRRLAGEGTSLRALIQEARLHTALAQLQNSRQPVKAVARNVGYRSIASFRRNFTVRFGLDPAQVANPVV